MRLDIGCGRTWPEGWEGLDRVDFGQKYICDLERVGEAHPFGNYDCDNVEHPPIDDNSVEAIHMHNTLEHLTRPAALRVLNECWRVLRAGGTMEIITPNVLKGLDLAWADPTHLSCWVPGTFTQYFTGNRPRNSSYGIKPWIVLECRNYEEKEPRDIYCRMSPKK